MSALIRELEQLRRQKELAVLAIYRLHQWEPDIRERLRPFENELYRIARELDRLGRGGR